MNSKTEVISRPHVWLLVMTVVVFTSASFAQSTGSETQETSGKQFAQFPDNTLTPEQVVRGQLEALRNNGPTDGGIAICFRFASPNNQRNTGPLPRFVKMIKSGVYRLMLEYREAEYGVVEIINNRARQRVTLTSATQSISFVFYLSKQQHESCKDCWMTDSVAIERIHSKSA